MSLQMVDNETTEVIKPQPGPQEQFLATSADIAIYGGAAGGGKTYGLLLEPLRHLDNSEFDGVIFRRTTKQVRNQGGLWDTSMKLYPKFGAQPSGLDWKFPSRMGIGFAHLEHESDILSWQGAQVPFIGFDELTHFTESQFWYLISRNRSTSGVPGYVRATTNPDPDSWVAEFIEWWIDQDPDSETYGLAIPERSGVLRWFIRVNDKIIWADTRQELIDEYQVDDSEENQILPKSVTFIPSKLSDNKILMKADPSYKANLLAMDRVTRARLLDGNWKVKPAAGMYFKRTQFEIVEAAPANCRAIRYWDRASSEVTEHNPDPDWTVGLKLLKDDKNIYYVADVVRLRGTPLKVERAVKNTAIQDGISVTVYGEQDPGSAGVADAGNFTRLLSGFVVKINRPSTDKVKRAEPVSAQVEAENVKLIRGAWNKDFLSELENFPDGSHDDQVDALSGAFNMFNATKVGTFGNKQNKKPPPKPFAGSIARIKRST